MFILNLFFALFIFLNAFGVYVIGVACTVNATENNDFTYIWFYPLLIEVLREKLNIVGTIIITILLSVILMPAIILYFIVLAVIAFGYLEIKLFYKLFARKDN